MAVSSLGLQTWVSPLHIWHLLSGGRGWRRLGGLGVSCGLGRCSKPCVDTWVHGHAAQAHLLPLCCLFCSGEGGALHV